MNRDDESRAESHARRERPTLPFALSAKSQALDSFNGCNRLIEARMNTLE